MKRVVVLFLTCAVCHVVLSAQAPSGKTPELIYKMTTYQLVILKPGPKAAELHAAPDGGKLVQAHVGYLYQMAAEGTYAAAGSRSPRPAARGLRIADCGLRIAVCYSSAA